MINVKDILTGRVLLAFFLLLCSGPAGAQLRQYFAETPLFVNGTQAYACYRIPAVLAAPNGELLAFAEGRTYGCSDFGDVDIVMRRSRDNGHTWEGQSIVADNGRFQAGNPAPLVDYLDPEHPQGRIFLFYNTGNNHERAIREGKGIREVWYITSTDNGRSWSEPVNITEFVHRPYQPSFRAAYRFQEDWRHYANTPGHAIQLKQGKYAGRLFIPANHSIGDPLPGFMDYRAHAFYSDDHGKSWKRSQPVDIPGSNESIAVELPEGRLLMNSRDQTGISRRRIVSLSSDGGASWDTSYFDQQLISPVCQASIHRYSGPQGQDLLLFSNPKSTDKREKMTVRMSLDHGRSWVVERQLRSGASAYSDLVVQPDSLIGLLYEHGNEGGIHYAHFNYPWLIGGRNNSDNPWIKKILTPGPSPAYSFRLADPVLEVEDDFFRQHTQATLMLDFPGATIYYTTDGSEPVEGALRYMGPLQIDKSCALKARAFHPELQPSGIVSRQLIRTNKPLPMARAGLRYPPSEQYAGKGGATLTDLKKGSMNFRDGNWLGFLGDNLELTMELERAVGFDRVTVSLLSDPASWIFPPRSIEVWTSADGKHFEQIGDEQFPELAGEEAAQMKFLSVKTSLQTSRFIKVIVQSQQLLPEWHAGAGTPAWLFVDEVLVERKE